jgi:hypothetical protein
MKRLRAAVAVLWLSWFSAATGQSCTVCDTPTGMQVREGIFNESFWRHVAVTLAPFPVFALAVAWIFCGGRKPKRGAHERAQ